MRPALPPALSRVPPLSPLSRLKDGDDSAFLTGLVRSHTCCTRPHMNDKHLVNTPGLKSLSCHLSAVTSLSFPSKDDADMGGSYSLSVLCATASM